MNKESVECGIATSPEKHLQLSGAINTIGSINEALARLLDRISGPSPEKCPGEDLKPNQPTLSNVLNTGACDIHDKIEKAHSLIGQITEELF